MATFQTLDPSEHYLIIDGVTGHSRGDGLSGAAVMSEIWNAGDEAWPAGEQEFSDAPVEIAE